MGNCANGCGCGCCSSSCGPCDDTCGPSVVNVPIAEYDQGDGSFSGPLDVWGPNPAAVGGAIVGAAIETKSLTSSGVLTLQFYKNNVPVTGASVAIPAAPADGSVFYITKCVPFKKGDILELVASGTGIGSSFKLYMSLGMRASS